MIITDNINDIPMRAKKAGFYEYKGKYYINKFQALEAAGNDYVTWHFNNEEFGKFDWSKEPDTDLYNMYAQRARQLRQKYDKVVIYFSGGIDSLTVLRTFVDNNIPIDAVVIWGMFNHNNQKGSWIDINVAEQNMVALPLLKQIEQEKGIKLPIFCLDTLDHHYKFTEGWIYRTAYNITPTSSTMCYYDSDPFITQLAMSGDTCTIRGIDKPRVIIQDGKWYLAFLDVGMSGATCYDTYNIGLQNYPEDEYFYWSTDCMPLIAKQSHMIVRELEKRFTSAQLKQKFGNLGKFDKDEYGRFSEPTVYGRYVNQKIGEKRPYFYVKSGLTGSMQPKSWWFNHAKSDLGSAYENYVQGVLSVNNNIDPMHFNRVPDDPVKVADVMKKSQLDPRLALVPGQSTVLMGTVGCWSPFYYLKDVK